MGKRIGSVVLSRSIKIQFDKRFERDGYDLEIVVKATVDRTEHGIYVDVDTALDACGRCLFDELSESEFHELQVDAADKAEEYAHGNMQRE